MTMHDRLAQAMPTRTVCIHWYSVDDVMPDAGETVLINCPDSVEPVWMGWAENTDAGPVWYDSEGTPLADDAVTHWATMPEGARE